MTEPAKDAVHPLTRAAWRAWLETHHTRPAGVWLVSYKKATGKPRFEYGEAVEEALCFGWIDSKANKLDDERSMLWFAPRKPRTGWSRPNQERVERLIECGRMAAAGLAKIEAAKADGSWNVLDAVEALEVPDDLRRAFRRHRGSTANFEAFPRSAKRGILEWIVQAKRPETRAARIAETAELAARNIRANQWRDQRAKPVVPGDRGAAAVMRELRSARLRLVPQCAEHAPAMFDVLSDPRIYEHENAPPASVHALRDRFARLESRRSPDGGEQWLNWVIEFDRRLVGYVQASVGGDGHAAIAYELGSRWWGHGLAGEAVDTMLDELASHHGAATLGAVLKRSNRRSIALLERRAFALGDSGAHAGVDADEWHMLRDAAPGVRVARESPRQPDAIALIDALDAYQRPLYPPESHHGIDIDTLAAPDVVFAIARVAGRAVGCGAVRMAGDEAELKRMYIETRHRGRRIAEALLRFLEGASVIRAAGMLRLETGIHQHAALALYARHGFVRGAPFGRYAPDPLSVFMHKPLVAPR